MRLIFIPGFGEDPGIFDRIHAHLEGQKLFIDNWELLAEVSGNKISATTYAQYLTDKYKTNQDDIIIGHSMGGWIALYIKQITGCRIIQVASWTKGSKVIQFPVYRPLLYWLTKNKLIFNCLTQKALVWLYYKNQPSKEIFAAVFQNLRTRNKQIVIKQLMVIFNPVKKPLTIVPDLRIHAKADRVIRYPDEAFVQVPGDHFSLCTFPADVYKPIADFLNQK